MAALGVGKVGCCILTIGVALYRMIETQRDGVRIIFVHTFVTFLYRSIAPLSDLRTQNPYPEDVFLGDVLCCAHQLQSQNHLYV